VRLLSGRVADLPVHLGLQSSLAATFLDWPDPGSQTIDFMGRKFPESYLPPKTILAHLIEVT
jgi:hypothetical protein